MSDASSNDLLESGGGVEGERVQAKECAETFRRERVREALERGRREREDSWSGCRGCWFEERRRGRRRRRGEDGVVDERSD